MRYSHLLVVEFSHTLSEKKYFTSNPAVFQGNRAGDTLAEDKMEEFPGRAFAFSGGFFSVWQSEQPQQKFNQKVQPYLQDSALGNSVHEKRSPDHAQAGKRYKGEAKPSMNARYNLRHFANTFGDSHFSDDQL